MELTQLRYFQAVATSLHMTATAEQLHVAQPALSQAISRLEKEFGVALFARTGRRLELTPSGAFLRDKLSAPLAVLGQLPESLRSFDAAEQKTVRLNVLAASMVVTDAIIAYQAEHPDTHFSLLQNPDAKGCDLTLTTGRHASSAPDGDTFVLEEEIYLAVPRTGKYGKRSSLSLAEMAEENFISLAGSRRLRGICDRFCMEAGFAPHIGFESDNPASVRNLIAARAGVGFWPAFSFGHYDDESVLLLPIDDVNCRRLLILHHHPRTTANADGGEQLRFFRFLSDYFTRARDTARR